MTEQTSTAINVPWTPGRGVSYESALEDEIGALRGAIHALVMGNRVDESRPLPWMIGSPADEAYHRALGRENGS